MHTGKQRNDRGERQTHVEQAENRAQPPRRDAENRETEGVPQREQLPESKVKEEPKNSRPVWVLGNKRAKEQRDIQACEPRHLCNDE